MKRLYISIVVLALLGLKANAQQDVMFTQYMFNAMALNPAYAGSHDALNVTALGRKQWVNIDGAPLSMTLSAHTPINPHPMGVGLQVINDRIGIVKETIVYGSYAYWIKTSAKGRLSFGLQAGANFFKADYNELKLKHSNDQVFTGAPSTTKPNFGAGIYYYTDRFYLGLASPRLVEHSIQNGNDKESFKQRRHQFLSAGYVFDLNPNWKFKPNLLIKHVEGSPVEFDINANFLLAEKLWLGASWRSFDSFDFLTQFLVTEQLSIGYSYDLTLTKLASFNKGSHELMVSYLFKYNGDKILTTRYF